MSLEEDLTEEIIVVTDKKEKIKPENNITVVDVNTDEGKDLVGSEPVPENALPRAFIVQRRMQTCKINVNEGNLVADCAGKTINLGTIEAEKVAEQVTAKLEECPRCSGSIAVGWAIQKIKPLNDLIAAKILNDVIDQQISPDEAVEKCIQVAQGHGKADIAHTLQYLKEVMHKTPEELRNESKEHV